MLDLSKGKAALTSDGTPGGQRVSRVSFGFGWDVSGGGQKGIRGRINKLKGVDLDASVIAFDSTKTPIGCAYYDNLRPFGGALTHTGDNRTGKGDGPDELIEANLDALPPEVQWLVCTLSSYKGASFEKVNNATFEIYNGGATEANRIALVYMPIQGSNTAAVMAVVKRTSDGGWEVSKQSLLGHGRTWRDLANLADPLLV